MLGQVFPPPFPDGESVPVVPRVTVRTGAASEVVRAEQATEAVVGPLPLAARHISKQAGVPIVGASALALRQQHVGGEAAEARAIRQRYPALAKARRPRVRGTLPTPTDVTRTPPAVPSFPSEVPPSVTSPVEASITPAIAPPYWTAETQATGVVTPTEAEQVPPFIPSVTAQPPPPAQAPVDVAPFLERIPTWGWLALGAGVFFLMGGRG